MPGAEKRRRRHNGFAQCKVLRRMQDLDAEF